MVHSIHTHYSSQTPTFITLSLYPILFYFAHFLLLIFYCIFCVLIEKSPDHHMWWNRTANHRPLSGGSLTGGAALRLLLAIPVGTATTARDLIY